jgi:putative sigma-54 modulation protein
MHVPRSNGNLHANSVQEDMYAAIDTLVDKLDRQILKHKEKLTDHHRKEKVGLGS